MHKRIISVLCCVLAVCVFGTSTAFALEPSQLADEITGGLLDQSGAQDIQQYIGTVLADSAGEGGEEIFLALTQRGGQYDTTAYAASLLDYLSTHRVPAATTRQKYALTLMAAGCQSDYIAQVMDDSAGTLGVMSWVYCLHLLNNGAVGGGLDAEQVINQLLSLRLEDSGWAVYGTVSDVDVTAMVLQSLAPYYGSNDKVTAAVDGALTLLSERQQPDGGFASFGTANTESAAQVIIALCALNIDPQTDPRFVREGGSAVDGMLAGRLESGGFAHVPGGEYSAAATGQALCALVAMERLQAGRGSLYVLDDRADCTPENVVYTPYVPAGQEPDSSEEHSAGNYKPWAVGVIILLAAGVCAALWLSGKRSGKNFAAVAVASLVLAGAVLMLDIQTADQYYGTAVEKPDALGEVSFSVTCDAIAGSADAPHVPEDGIILSERSLPLCEGETVYDLLLQAAQAEGFTVESGATAYIQGIAGIREHDFGELSGWVYRVNGQIPSQGCDSYVLKAGDRVEWLYSLELGREFENAE